MNGKIGKWIVALPGNVGVKYYYDKAREYGFMTYPQFMDNFFCQEGVNFPRFWKALQKFKGEVEMAIYPDYGYDKDFLLKNYSTNWVFPLHKTTEADYILKHDFEWIGMPYSQRRRQYSIEWFVNFAKQHGYKSWYLGWFWRKTEKEHALLHFDGIDTTSLSKYCINHGKVLRTWNKYEEAFNVSRVEIFETSLANFKRDLLNLSNGKHPIKQLEEFFPVSVSSQKSVQSDQK